MPENIKVTLGAIREVVLTIPEGLRAIPEYSLYAVSSDGKQVVNVLTNTVCSQRESATKVGTYLTTSVRKTPQSKFKSIGVHVLVCLAFRGLPPQDGLKYEVNHKDGDKHNNDESNVEWVTRRDNIIHACVTGLRKNCNRVIMTNLVTGEETWYYSVIEASRQLGITRTEMYRRVRDHKENPLEGFTYRYDMSQRKVTKHPSLKDILMFDHVDKKHVVATDALLLQEISGIKQQTVIADIRNKRYGVIGGYSFCYLGDETPFPKISREEAIRSREEYFNKPQASKKKKGIVVKDYVTDTVMEYPNAKIASQKTGVVRGTIMYLVNLPELKMSKGKVFKYTACDLEFPTYSELEVRMSATAEKAGCEVIKVTDVQLGTTEHYPSVAMFARHVGEHPLNAAQWVKAQGTRPFKKRWIIERTGIFS